MYKRRDIDTTGEGNTEIVENGSPVVILGTSSCSLNGIHAYYHDINEIEVVEPRFGAASLCVRFRRGIVLRFTGPKFLHPGRKRFLEDVRRLKSNISQLAREHWRDVLSSHFMRDRPFSIDSFRYTPTGDIYDNDQYITNISLSGFKSRVENGKLLLSFSPQPGRAGPQDHVFDVGPHPDIVSTLLTERSKRQAQKDKNEWSRQEEDASRAIVMLAALAGSWNKNDFEQRLTKFAKLRGIDFDLLGMDVKNLNYQRLVFDRRVLRTLYDSVASFCSVPARARALRFDDLVGDLVAVAADNRKLSDVSLYLIYEVALFQGNSLGHVAKLISQALGDDGSAWKK